MNPVSNYEKWKEEVISKELSHYKSLKFSLKVKQSTDGRSVLTFKNTQKVASDDDDRDSASSQSSCHMRRFNLDGKSMNRQEEAGFLKVMKKFHDGIERLPDMTSDQVGTNIGVKARMYTGEVYEFMTISPKIVL